MTAIATCVVGALVVLAALLALGSVIGRLLRREAESYPLADPHQGRVVVDEVTDGRGNPVGERAMWRCHCLSYGYANTATEAWTNHERHRTARLAQASR